MENTEKTHKNRLIELTRHQNFIEGKSDIFDLLLSDFKPSQDTDIRQDNSSIWGRF